MKLIIKDDIAVFLPRNFSTGKNCEILELSKYYFEKYRLVDRYEATLAARMR